MVKMTTNDRSDHALAANASTRVLPADIEQVDVFARKLYKRSRAAERGLGDRGLEEIADTVRCLHTVLKHLKFEAEDTESLLNIDGSGVYARQLRPILEDSGFALRQLDTILEKKYGGGGGGGNGEGGHGAQMDGEKGWTMLDGRERDMIDLIRTKLANQKLSIDMFLDTIQLHNPSKSRRMVDTSSADLDSIKDKVDAIASRICRRKDSNLGDNEEELWERFRDELERAGFSRDILRKNQDVIRAYIRQLDEQLSAHGGSTPSVRGLLESYRRPLDNNDNNGLQVTPYPTYSSPTDATPRRRHTIIDDEKFFPSARMERLQGEGKHLPPPPPPSMPDRLTCLSYGRRSFDGEEAGAPTESMALMSTRDLITLDKRATDLARSMGSIHLQPPAGIDYNMSASPTALHPPPSTSNPTLLSTFPQATINTAGQPTALARHVPQLPPASVSSHSAPRTSSISAPIITQQPQRSICLGPDSQGREIPLDAKWTRIPRRLVSPEVLAGAGVRYEARPDFVAVLGELTRNEVADFAKRTAEVRNARRRPSVTAASGARKERKAEDKYYPDKYRNWDVIEAQRRSRRQEGWDVGGSRAVDDDDGEGVEYVVNTGRRRRAGSTASSVSELYDSSSDNASSSSSMDRDEHGRDQDPYDSSSSYSQSYPRSSVHPGFHQHVQLQPRRRDSTPAPIPHSSRSKYDDGTRARSRARADSGEGDHGDDKGTKVYPFIVPSPPTSENGSKGRAKERDGTSASSNATVKPKPILKNKNDDPHVRFDPEPQILEGPSSVPRSLPSYRRSEREREKNRDRDRDRDRDREKRYRSDRYPDRERDRDRHREKDYHREREREGRDRERDGGEEPAHRHYHRSHGHGHGHHGSGGSSTRREREREYYDDHYDGRSSSSRRKDKDERAARRKSHSETLRAVGLGSAAASLLSVLSEAM
ncbi:hypothetical protein AAE478_002702 [Parahypoxylon ruwenzoriense]